MDNKPNNLYQPPQSSQPTAQPTPEPPKSNKLWPINWMHNRTLKIFSLTSIIVFCLSLLSILIIPATIIFFSIFPALNPSTNTPSTKTLDCAGTQLCAEPFKPAQIAVSLFWWFFIISSIFAICAIITASFKIKKLDKTDKISILINILSLSFFIYLFIDLITGGNPSVIFI